jgi:uridine phosphorylase
MLEIKGLFTTGKIKGVGTGEVLTIVNSTKNNNFTNLTIIPTKIKVYERNSNYGSR